MSFIPQNAAELVPQRTPFIWVDQLVYADDKTSHSSFKIPAENIFVKNGLYSTSGMVESMAQTAAAGTGYRSKKENKPVPLGYIGAVQKLEVTGWAPAGATITMEINLLTHIMQVSLVSCQVKYNGKILASCEMKIFVNNQS